MNLVKLFLVGITEQLLSKSNKQSKFILKNNGLLAMEIGQGQYFKVSEILKKIIFVFQR